MTMEQITQIKILIETNKQSYRVIFTKPDKINSLIKDKDLTFGELVEGMIIVYNEMPNGTLRGVKIDDLPF